MADIFGKEITIAPGPIGRAETFEVYAIGEGTSNETFIGLAQGIQNTYSRPTEIIQDLTDYRAFTVTGRPTGNLSISRLVGRAMGDSETPSGPTIVSLLAEFSGDPFFTSDGSSGGKIVFTEVTTGAGWQCSGCHVTQETVSAEVNGIVISEQIVISYHKLEVVKERTSTAPNSRKNKQAGNPPPVTPPTNTFPEQAAGDLAGAADDLAGAADVVDNTAEELAIAAAAGVALAVGVAFPPVGIALAVGTAAVGASLAIENFFGDGQ
jgi:hypothetical protein